MKLTRPYRRHGQGPVTTSANCDGRVATAPVEPRRGAGDKAIAACFGARRRARRYLECAGAPGLSESQQPVARSALFSFIF